MMVAKRCPLFSMVFNSANLRVTFARAVVREVVFGSGVVIFTLLIGRRKVLFLFIWSILAAARSAAAFAVERLALATACSAERTTVRLATRPAAADTSPAREIPLTIFPGPPACATAGKRKTEDNKGNRYCFIFIL